MKRRLLPLGSLWLFWLAGPVSAASLPDSTAPGGSEYGREFVMPKRPPIPKEVLVPSAEEKAAMPSPANTSGEQGASPNASNSPQILVKRLQLDGAVDHPDADIYVADVQALLDRLLAEQLGVDPQASAQAKGLSDAELQAELLRLKQRLESPQAADDALTPDAVQSLIDKLQADQSRAGLSIEALQGIAAEVARYYRQHGLILTQAYIPPQTIREGVVIIRVVEGRLGQVMVEKTRRYSVPQLVQPFSDLIGQPVDKHAIEEALLLLSDYPGLSSFGVFQPGNYAGETDMVISVLGEKRVEAMLHADNYGSQYTGEYRARADLIVNNPFNWQDRFLLHVSRTFEPNNGFYGGAGYELSAFGARNTFGLSFLNNAYDMGGILQPFGLTGTTRVADLYWRRKFSRSQHFNSFGVLKFARKSVKLDVLEGRDTADELSVFTGELGYDWRTSGGRNYQSGWFQFSQGVSGLFGSMEGSTDPEQATANRRGGTGEYASSQFNKFAVDFQNWFNFSQTHTLRIAARGQYSADLLTSIEQFSMGGPGSVRAYANAEYLADYGYSVSAEWLMRAPGFAQWNAFGGKTWGEILQFVLFVDTAQGWLNDPLASDRENVSLHGTGLGLRLYTNAFSMRVEVATPIGEEVASNGRDPQYFFEFNYEL